MSECDYSVDIAGIAETLWGWPLDGYDLVLIDATDQAADGIILCDHVKKLRPEQRVLILVGQRPGLFPFRVAADAVFSGTLDGPELAGAVSFLLAESGAGPQPFAEKKVAASATSWGRANR
jgi:DNA-binding response OmpR family regulator